MSEKEFKEIFSKRLRFYLDARGMTQTELAKKLKVSVTSVGYWCNGVKIPRMDKVDAMCRIFGCSRTDLMDEKNEDSTSSLRRLSADESALLSDYNRLNDLGKEKARIDISDLTQIAKYTGKPVPFSKEEREKELADSFAS